MGKIICVCLALSILCSCSTNKTDSSSSPLYTIEYSSSTSSEAGKVPDISNSSEEISEVESSSDSSESDSVNYHGELLDKIITSDVNPDGDICVLKFKIESNLTNEMTISQNYFNVENFVLYDGGNEFAEIQYWAVANFTDGSEGKVISFAIDSDTIQGIFNRTIVAIELEDYVTDLWILPQLLAND